MTIYGMYFVGSEHLVCILERITTVYGFCTSDNIYTKSPKTKKSQHSKYCTLYYTSDFFFTNKKSVLNGI